MKTQIIESTISKHDVSAYAKLGGFGRGRSRGEASEPDRRFMEERSEAWSSRGIDLSRYRLIYESPHQSNGDTRGDYRRTSYGIPGNRCEDATR